MTHPVWILLLLAIACPGRLGAQVPLSESGGGPHRGAHRPDLTPPNKEADDLRKQADQFRFKGYDMVAKADELRDNNNDDLADNLDEHAETFFERARSLDRRARQIELSSGQHPERVHIPDL